MHALFILKTLCQIFFIANIATIILSCKGNKFALKLKKFINKENNASLAYCALFYMSFFGSIIPLAA